MNRIKDLLKYLVLFLIFLVQMFWIYCINNAVVFEKKASNWKLVVPSGVMYVALSVIVEVLK